MGNEGDHRMEVRKNKASERSAIKNAADDAAELDGEGPWTRFISLFQAMPAIRW
jgi:hypothetical protein